jgi:hypothetical protein
MRIVELVGLLLIVSFAQLVFVRHMLLVRSGEAWTTVDDVRFPGNGPAKRPIFGGFVFFQKLVESIDFVERHTLHLGLNPVPGELHELDRREFRLTADCVLRELHDALEEVIAELAVLRIRHRVGRLHLSFLLYGSCGC